MRFGDAAIVVARQHAREDLGGDVPLSWWVNQCRDLPKAREPVETTRGLLLERGWPPYGVNLILEVLSLGERFAGPEGIGVTANAFGVGLVRTIVGPPSRLSGNRWFDPAYLAEAVIMRWFRHIPSLSEIVTKLDPLYEKNLHENLARLHRDRT